MMIRIIAILLISVRQKEISEIAPTRVTQGKTFGNDEKVFAAAHAVDRDLSTVAATHSENGAGWIKLEFDKTYFIHKVVIYCRFYLNWYDSNGHCAQSKTNFVGCVNHANNVDVSVYQETVKQHTCGTLQLTYGLKQSDQIYTLLCNVKGDTVKLSKAKDVIVVGEVAVTSKGIYFNIKSKSFNNAYSFMFEK